MSLREKLQPDVLRKLAAELGVTIKPGQWRSQFICKTPGEWQATCMCPITTYLTGTGCKFEPDDDGPGAHEVICEEAAKLLGCEVDEVTDFVRGFDANEFGIAHNKHTEAFKFGVELRKELAP